MFLSFFFFYLIVVFCGSSAIFRSQNVAYCFKNFKNDSFLIFEKLVRFFSKNFNIVPLSVCLCVYCNFDGLSLEQLEGFPAFVNLCSKFISGRVVCVLLS